MGVLEFLEKAKDQNIITVILSTSPHPKKKANKLLKSKIDYFQLNEYIDEYYATDDYPESKGEYIERILIKKQIDKSNAIMIGDSYKWDYKSATDIGVDAILIESKYEDETTEANHRVQSIVELEDYFV